jgi:hypothetical protein
MTAARFLKLLMRLSGVGALLLGLAIWAGYGTSWLPIHILLGAILVLAMWGTAVLAFRTGLRRGLGVFVFLWGLGMAVFGGLQGRLLPGPTHWLIAVAHVLAGPVGAALGVVLGSALERPLAGSTQGTSGASARAAA